jgi:putative flavoprotein involved in K+ transport
MPAPGRQLDARRRTHKTDEETTMTDGQATRSVSTVVVGAGQAGLALSRCLMDHGVEHVLLERGRLGERWRSERWDSFRLLSPTWLTRLPGWSYGGPDPDGFLDRAEVVELLETYARSFDPPLHEGVTVTDIRPAQPGWEVTTSGGRWLADNVVVATGHLDRPQVPALAGHLHPTVHQLHSSRYRNPQQLPPGAVLIVGAGPSGQQIAAELARAGRRVHVAVGRHRPLPRRWRGRDVYDWMRELGMLDRTIDTLPDPRRAHQAPNAVLAAGAQDLNLRRLVRLGVVAHGRLLAVRGDRLTFAGDLAERLREADEHDVRFRATVDAHLCGGPARPVSVATSTAPWVRDAPQALSLSHDGVRSVVWATGYGRDYSWVNAPVFDEHGHPVQWRGETEAPGLFFLGLRWMYRRSSSSLDGVGADAEHLAGLIAQRCRVPVPA